MKKMVRARELKRNSLDNNEYNDICIIKDITKLWREIVDLAGTTISQVKRYEHF